MWIDQQWHGYRRGHQLLASTVELDSRDQDLVDKLSDSSGAPRPGQQFEPYISAYPLPSGTRYVVARTWQDLEAPRTGTVFTRSLLIDIDEWQSVPSVRSFFDALSDRSFSREPTFINPTSVEWPAVHDAKLAELAEALFLERTSAVAGFDFRQAEIVAGRLLDALWPTRRSTMAICTYALAPRFLNDRSFDLVFAPATAKSRFGKWSGRKIGGGSASAAPRHPWTITLVDRVFHDPEPDLRDLDELGAMNAASGNDGSALRLSLLWSDLKTSTATTPRSLLGMLDVLSSVGRNPWQLPYFGSLVAEAIRKASLGPKLEAWEFLLLLVEKLGTGIPLGVVRSIHAGASKLAEQDPAALGQELGSMGDISAVPRLLRPAMASGLSRAEQVDVVSFIKQVGPPTTLALMAESPAFACKVSGTLSRAPISKFIAALTSLVEENRRALVRVASGVSKGVESTHLAEFLKTILQGSPKGNFGLLAGNVIGNHGLEIAEIRNALVDAARSKSSERQLAIMALASPDDSAADETLLELIESQEDTAWLIEGLEAEPSRRSELLIRLMSRWSDDQCTKIIRDAGNRNSLIEAAISAKKRGVAPLRRLLGSSRLTPASAAAILRRAFPDLTMSDRATISTAVLDEIFSLDPRTTSDLLGPILLGVDPITVLEAAASPNLDTKQVGLNIAAIATAGPRVLERFATHIDLITDTLVRRRGGYGREGYDGWAALMRQARKASPQALLRCVDEALHYGLNRRREPCGAVISAAFPIIHARLAKKSPPPDGFAGIIFASLTLFTDWDKAKSLRHFVVEAFVESSWEPAELLRAGVEARVTPKMLGYLVSLPKGRAYFRKLEQSAKGYPEPVKGTLLKAVRDYSKQ